MSKALHSKIDAACGLPPRLRRASQLWSLIDVAVARFTAAELGEGWSLHRSERKAAAADALDLCASEGPSFSFPRGAMPGIAALFLSEPAARILCARRMGQAPGSLEGAPVALLSLMAEQAAATLCREAARLEGHAAAAAPAAAASAAPVRPGAEWAAQGRLVLSSQSFMKAGLPNVRVSLALRTGWLIREAARLAALAPDARVSPAEGAVLGAPVDAFAGLASFQLTVGECARLRPGQLIPLPNADLSRVEITSRGGSASALAGLSGGAPASAPVSVAVASGTLGSWRGKRAVALRAGSAAKPASASPPAPSPAPDLSPPFSPPPAPEPAQEHSL